MFCIPYRLHYRNEAPVFFSWLKRWPVVLSSCALSGSVFGFWLVLGGSSLRGVREGRNEAGERHHPTGPEVGGPGTEAGRRGRSARGGECFRGK